MRSLVGELNEAASLGVLDGADILYVDRVRAGLTRIGVDIRIGTTIPAFWSTIGEAMLAFLPTDRTVDASLSLKPRLRQFSEQADDQGRNHTQSARYGEQRIFVARFLFRQRPYGFPRCRCSMLDNYPLAAVSVAVPADPVCRSRNSAAVRLGRSSRATKDLARAVQASGTISATA